MPIQIESKKIKKNRFSNTQNNYFKTFYKTKIELNISYFMLLPLSFTKKILWNFLSDCYPRNTSLASYIYLFPCPPVSYKNASVSLIDSASWILNQGWVIISLIPLREPMRWLGFLARRPRIKDFTYLLTAGVLGNLGSEWRIAWKIYYFLGA